MIQWNHLKAMLYAIATTALLLNCNTPSGQQQETNKSGGGHPFLAETYVMESGSMAGELAIDKVTKDFIEFDLLLVTESGCTGEISGQAKITEGRIARYEAEGCESLILTVVENGVHISESNCSGFHGARCTFDGTYVIDSPVDHTGTHCFLSINEGKPIVMNGDTAQLMIDSTKLLLVVNGDQASGTYEYLPAESDAMRGSFKGLLLGDKIEAVYDYSQEGESYRQGLIILLKDGSVQTALAELSTETGANTIIERRGNEYTTLQSVACK